MEERITALEQAVEQLQLRSAGGAGPTIVK
jgi:hypothetical protein